MIEILLAAIAFQIIQVNQTDPCFLNYTAGIDIFQNCGATEDYIDFALLPWEWITGGFFSMVFVAIFILMVYLKYHKPVYPILVGIAFLPISYFLFPATFLAWALVMSAVGIACIIFYVFIKQTKEY